ncbi:MAG TPA: hypothetical protein EYP41_22550 [Anaerolineae bacterium]|nr:hypothetical protein [Anaerolineae bacterium]
MSRLHLGVPEAHVRLLQRMAADFGFSLKPKLTDTAIPTIRRMTAVTELPWQTAFVAHIVNEQVFISQVEERDSSGTYWPQPAPKEQLKAVWQLPDKPPAGLSTQPDWDGRQPSENLIARKPDPQRWPLGRTQTGIPLQTEGRLNIYGRQEAVADWLVHQVTQMVAVNPANLVVIDGIGDLVPKLKRKAVVTRLLGEQVAYVDIDGTSLATGFNPLTPVLGETEAETTLRWQHWFEGMNVHSEGIALLDQARQAGVEDILSLRKWVKQVERMGPSTAVTSLNMALSRLMSSRVLREWLEWPVNHFDILTGGALLFAVKGTDWARQQLLRAVCLGAVNVPNIRLVLHGFPWSHGAVAQLQSCERLCLSNAPLFDRAVIVLVENHVQHVAGLAQRFQADDMLLTENMHLLGRGEGVIISQKEPIFITWHPGGEKGNSEEIGSFDNKRLALCSK